MNPNPHPTQTVNLTPDLNLAPTTESDQFWCDVPYNCVLLPAQAHLLPSALATWTCAHAVLDPDLKPLILGLTQTLNPHLLPSALATWTCARAPTRTVTKSDSRRAFTASARLPPSVAAHRMCVPGPGADHSIQLSCYGLELKI